MQCMTENVPGELRERAQWVLWRYETNDKGKLTKVLYQTKHPERKASTDRFATWSDFASTIALVTPEQGMGFVFTADDPYCGIDLDGCVKDGVIESWAERIMLTFPGYAEYSPSGTGIHLIGKGKLRKGWNQKPLETYDRGRYFTFTGNVVPKRPTTIELWTRLADFELCIEAVSKALHDCLMFPALFSGDWSNYPSQSEADAGFTADLLRSGATTLEEVVAAVSLSGLWREKWERPDYQTSTYSTAQRLAAVPNNATQRPVSLEVKTDDGSLARYLQERLSGQLAYDKEAKVWRKRETYIWPAVEDTDAFDTIEEAIHGLLEKSYTKQTRDVMAMLLPKLSRTFDNSQGLPMLTQVLDLATKQTRDYASEDSFTWQLPYDYIEGATCPAVQDWITSATDDPDTLIAFARALVYGYTGAQMYLEAIGPGGTGKSTYANLLQALIGTSNMYPASFERLKSNKRFETQNFYGKRLLVFADGCRSHIEV